jgi:UDP-N-acetylglucosamine 2-epimerase (non-hydrolysing)
MSPDIAVPLRTGVIVGTRPEAIKLAPVISGLRSAPGFEPVVISTGQHREMLSQMLGLFGIGADVDLDLMTASQSLAGLTARIVSAMDEVLPALALDLMIVQGDTTSTMAGALAGFYHRVPVAHVEAGLRTGDPRSPYPEEVNRRIVTQLAGLHFAPTSAAAGNLVAEGVDVSRIHVTGNTVIDSLLHVARAQPPFTGPDAVALDRLTASDAPLLLVTAHRRESWANGLAGIATALRLLLARHPDLTMAFPVHKNPVVRQAVLPVLAALDADEARRILITEPLDYGGFIRLLQRADVVLTDSGGIQEEASTLGKPTLVTRDTTERPEAVAAGGAMLVGTDADRIAAQVSRLLTDERARRALTPVGLPYGDGQAAGRIVAALAAFAVSAGLRRTAPLAVRP